MPKLHVILKLVADPVIEPSDIVLEATFTNRSAESVSLNLHQASHPALVLELRDSNDQPVYLPPPGAPDVEDMAFSLGDMIVPGQSVAVQYAGFLDRSLGSGTYRVRWFSPYPELGGTRDDPLQSEWVEFSVRQTAVFPRGQSVAAFQAFGVQLQREWPSWIKWLLPLFEWLRCLIARIFLGRRCDRVFELEVDEPRTEVISNAPPGFEAWNGTYGWRARFHVRVEEATCRASVIVRVRLNGSLTNAQRDAWRTAIDAVWSNRFKQCGERCCCPNGYTIVVQIPFVTSGEHQVVTVGNMTTNMGNWGANDTIDVRHEYGHMLGALDEYFTVNGVNYGPGRQPTGNIMNNPANNPAAHHCDLIRATVQQLLGLNCTTEAVGQPC